MSLMINGMLFNDHYDLTIGLTPGDGNDIAEPMSCMVITPTNDLDELSGFVPPIDKTGLMMWILNPSSSKSIVIKHDSGSSVGNRIFTVSGRDIILQPRQIMQFIFMDSGQIGWWEIITNAFASSTITPSGTTGDQTITTASGSVNFAAGAGSLKVTNPLSTPNSIILATVASPDSDLKSVAIDQSVTGEFTLIPETSPGVETRVNFLVIN